MLLALNATSFSYVISWCFSHSQIFPLCLTHVAGALIFMKQQQEVSEWHIERHANISSLCAKNTSQYVAMMSLQSPKTNSAALCSCSAAIPEVSAYFQITPNLTWELIPWTYKHPTTSGATNALSYLQKCEGEIHLNGTYFSSSSTLLQLWKMLIILRFGGDRKPQPALWQMDESRNYIKLQWNPRESAPVWELSSELEAQL